MDLSSFVQRMKVSEGIEEVRLGRYSYQFGYSKKGNASLMDFKPSLTSAQWQIALKKIESQSDVFVITGKLHILVIHVDVMVYEPDEQNILKLNPSVENI